MTVEAGKHAIPATIRKEACSSAISPNLADCEREYREFRWETATLTSLGEQDMEQGFGVIYPPQVAVIGLGNVTERPWAENGSASACKVITATLAADHRVSDGHRGARYLATLGRLLAEPEKLR
jgi:pyruvate dehydrogenase E2 component (dihydrolipoamide acetyltransferase)